MLNWNELERIAVGPSNASKVTGKWAPLRVRPYLQSDDIFTVGVVFSQTRKKTLTTVLIEDFSPFGCLYGPAGPEQFQWLLNGVRDALLHSSDTKNLGPHVSFGSWQHAEGESAKLVADALFASVVMLRGRQKVVQIAKADSAYGLNTPQIRKRLESTLTRTNTALAQQTWHPDGIYRSINGRNEKLDLPLWSGRDLFQPDIFGTVISICYHEEAYRGFFLNGAFRDMSVMYDLLSATGKGGLFILRPKDAPTDLQQKIDLDVDRVGALLHQRKAIVEIDVDAAALCRKVLSFMQ